jgi:DNA-directed RNA polymerase specialized sigma24 family protein
MSLTNERGLWWADNPELMAIRQTVLDELNSAKKRTVEDDKPDHVVDDVLSGASWRELAAARDDLARARTRYADAVRAARTRGLSWGEIGRMLGVSKQQLHRRFRAR